MLVKTRKAQYIRAVRKALLRGLLIFSPLLFNGTHVLKAQKNDDFPSIEWSEDRPLEWKDYPFVIFRSGKRELAITSVKHSVRGYLRNETPDFEVKVLFVAEDSWTSDTTNTRLLAHEQLHFDIGELYRRKIVNKIERLRKTGEKQKAIYRYAIQKLLSDFRIFSEEYDKETQYGNLPEIQRKWQIKVWDELNRLHR